MIKSIKTIFIVSLLSCLQSYHATVYGQKASYDLNEIEQLFSKKVSNQHEEKVFVHTDRNIYVTGETIWLSAYCVDASTHLLSDLSKVLNVELIDDTGTPVHQDRIRLENGLGNGQIFVSPKVKSGQYTMRAYTNWMKNFNSRLVFKKEIAVLNPSSVLSRTEQSATSNKPAVSFFPEGGNLVAGLESKVAVHITDNYGIGIQAQGILTDDQDNQLVNFSTSSDGYAYFSMTPNSTTNYKVEIKLGETTHSYPLPKIEKTGITLSISSQDENTLRLKVRSTPGFSEISYLFFHCRGIIQKTERIIASDDKDIVVPLANWPIGVSHITILNEQLQPLAERLFFNSPPAHNRNGLTLNKAEFDKREMVNLSFSELIENLNEGANLSVSVSKYNESFENNENISSHLYLTSDLENNIIDPAKFIDNSADNSQEEIDLVMMTNGWRRFDWKEIKNESDSKKKYPAEINAPLLSGLIKPNPNGKLPRSINVNFLGKSSIMNSLSIEEGGIFHFEVPFRLRNESVHFFSNTDTISSNQLSVFSPFDLKFESNKSNFTFPPESKTYLESLNANIQISQIYRDINNINGSEEQVEENNRHFYGDPDFMYLLDDYTRFETVRDLFIEYIRSAVIRKRNKSLGFYIVNSSTVNSQALTMIDGVPILDPNFMLEFDPLKIEKIGVVNKNYHMGNSSYQGIINFTTYKGDFADQELPEYLIEKVFNRIQQRRIFYSPNYALHASTLKRTPDYRNTLYWNPNINITKDTTLDLEFFTSDDSDQYKIEINGITDSGEPIYKKEIIRIP